MWKCNRRTSYPLLAGMAAILVSANSADARCAYDRQLAVTYANRWATGFNTEYANYENSGGDCANFASQCLIAGGINIERWASPGYLQGNSGKKTIPLVANLVNFLENFSRDYGQERILYSETTPDLTPALYTGDVVTLWIEYPNAPTSNWHHSVVVVEKILNVNDYGQTYADNFTVNSHSTTSGAYNYRASLAHFWNWNTYRRAKFFSINRTGDESDAECHVGTDDPGTGGGDPPPTGCGNLQKRWAPTADN